MSMFKDVYTTDLNDDNGMIDPGIALTKFMKIHREAKRVGMPVRLIVGPEFIGKVLRDEILSDPVNFDLRRIHACDLSISQKFAEMPDVLVFRIGDRMTVVKNRGLIPEEKPESFRSTKNFVKAA
jgi:hypothetical protein